MISCYVLMAFNLINLFISVAMGIWEFPFLGSNHAQFSLFAILVFVLAETIVMYFFIATGKQYSVRQFIEESAPYFDMNIRWEGSGLDEVGIDSDGKTVIRIDSKYFRPAEVETLLGDASKAKEKMGWEPRTSFKQLVEEMCNHEC